MSNGITIRDVDAMTWAIMKEQATMLVKSGFLPESVDTPEKAMAIAMKGRELGLPMMQSITSIHVIKGKPTISAELMAALVLQRIHGAVLRCIETTNTICTYEAGRPGDKILRMSFTWQDAVQAGVTNKDNWKQYPAAMLRARCCSAICRIVFPDAIMGCYTPDELGAITSEEGTIEETETITITPAPIAQPQAKSTTQPTEQGQPNNPAGGELIQEGFVDKVEESSGKKKDGTAWTRYAIHINGMIASTFSKTDGEKAQIAQENQTPVRLSYTQNGRFFECTGIIEKRNPGQEG